VARFGEVFGTAFQLSDDLIDVLSETGESGKTPGTDLREGIRTLPVLLVLAGEGASDPDDARLRELLAGELDDDDRLAEALRLLRRHPAMAAARARLAACVDQGRSVAADLPPGPVRDSLAALSDFVLARTG
jgi:heptaprenyl diphosphate synthase